MYTINFYNQWFKIKELCYVLINGFRFSFSNCFRKMLRDIVRTIKESLIIWNMDYRKRAYEYRMSRFWRQDLRVTFAGRCSLTRLRRQYVAIYIYTSLRSTDMCCCYRRHRSPTLVFANENSKFSDIKSWREATLSHTTMYFTTYQTN